MNKTKCIIKCIKMQFGYKIDNKGYTVIQTEDVFNVIPNYDLWLQEQCDPFSHMIPFLIVQSN